MPLSTGRGDLSCLCQPSVGTAGRKAGCPEEGQVLFDKGAVSISAPTLAACSARLLQRLGSTVGAVHRTNAALPCLWSLEDRLAKAAAVKGLLSPRLAPAG